MEYDNLPSVARQPPQPDPRTKQIKLYLENRVMPLLSPLQI